MGLLDGFINSQIGGIGAAVFGKCRTKPFDTSRNKYFAPFLNKNPLTIVVQGPTKANYISGGIQGATDSFWTHVLVMGNRHTHELMREMFPELFAEKDWMKKEGVKPIPWKPLDLEFAEATLPRCRVASYGNHYLGWDTQAIAFGFPNMTHEQAAKILCYAYSRHGYKYDVSEILADAVPAAQFKHAKRFHGCSSMVATSCSLAGIDIVGPNVAPYMAWPKHIYEWLYPQKKLEIATWNIM